MNYYATSSDQNPGYSQRTQYRSSGPSTSMNYLPRSVATDYFVQPGGPPGPSTGGYYVQEGPGGGGGGCGMRSSSAAMDFYGQGPTNAGSGVTRPDYLFQTVPSAGAFQSGSTCPCVAAAAATGGNRQQVISYTTPPIITESTAFPLMATPPAGVGYYPGLAGSSYGPSPAPVYYDAIDGPFDPMRQIPGGLDRFVYQRSGVMGPVGGGPFVGGSAGGGAGPIVGGGPATIGPQVMQIYASKPPQAEQGLWRKVTAAEYKKYKPKN